MSKEWYFRKADDPEVCGPVDWDTLVRMASSGELQATDELRHEDSDLWRAADAAKGLFTSTPKPLPEETTDEDDRPPSLMAGLEEEEPHEETEPTTVVQRIVLFAKASALELACNVKALGIFGLTKYRRQRLQKKQLAAQIALGEWLCRKKDGDEGLRSQISDLDDRIKSVKAGQGAVGSLEAERKGLKVRLAKEFARTNRDQSDTDNKRLSKLRRIEHSLVSTAKKVEKLRGDMWPQSTQRRRHLLTGYCAAALVLCGALWMLRDPVQEVAGVTDQEQLGQVLGLVVAGAEVNQLSNGAHIERTVGMGTGFVISRHGYIVTNREVVQSVHDMQSNESLLDRLKKEGLEVKPQIWVFLGKDKKFLADVRYVSEKHDLAILKIDAQHLPVFRLYAGDDLPKASKAFACSFPSATHINLSEDEKWSNVRLSGIGGTLESQLKPRDFEYALSEGQVSRSAQEHDLKILEHDAKFGGPNTIGGILIRGDGVVVALNMQVDKKDQTVLISEFRREISRHVSGTRWSN